MKQSVAENEEGVDQEIRDRELIARVIEKDDPEAFGVLIQRYQRKIYALIYNMTSNHEDTEDLVQVVFIKTYKALKRFRGQSSFYTWIYRIAINNTINFIKKRKRKAALSMDDMDLGLDRDPDYVELSSRSNPLKETSISELQEKLNKALNKLSDKHRMVVVLHDIQGIPHDDIAKMLGCSSGTLRSRLFYARKQLQVELKEFAP